MTPPEVTRQGVANPRPGRQAPTGGRRGGAEAAMVPEATFDSYYGKPVINQPVWESPDIPGYFYFGGLAGASSVMAAAAEASRRPRLARASKLAAAGGLGLSLLGLIHDLGRPERFLNMLRVFKPTSPMSVGSWLLSIYGPLAVAAAGSEVTGWFPRAGTAAAFGAALVGPAVASYTGVLVADTAVPAWHEGHREMPYVFVSSAAVAAAGAGLLSAPVAENAPARRMAAIGVAGELAGSALMERRMGLVAEPYRRGKAGALVRAGQGLAVVGAAGAALAGRRSRLAAALSGLALMVGSACTKWGIFEAGLASARDPRYTVVPQRQRAGTVGEHRTGQPPPG
ncbi:MAG TPA: NrfD/PsrC family molybdoenzyme membrane anchor subunit [Acidimicrobiales bacterium]|nr:NrfD/PsrC family molybdoenzyme membrane anchor subunit [Acidimicrobiales bacterium]